MGFKYSHFLVPYVLPEAKVEFLQWSAVQSRAVISQWPYLADTAK